jgi:hypothetical protein
LYHQTIPGEEAVGTNAADGAMFDAMPRLHRAPPSSTGVEESTIDASETLASPPPLPPPLLEPLPPPSGPTPLIASELTATPPSSSVPPEPPEEDVPSGEPGPVSADSWAALEPQAHSAPAAARDANHKNLGFVAPEGTGKPRRVPRAREHASRHAAGGRSSRGARATKARYR